MLSGNWMMNSVCCFVCDDNYWGDLVDYVDVMVVVGEYNSMVLELYVCIFVNCFCVKFEV